MGSWPRDPVFWEFQNQKLTFFLEGCNPVSISEAFGISFRDNNWTAELENRIWSNKKLFKPCSTDRKKGKTITTHAKNEKNMKNICISQTWQEIQLNTNTFSNVVRIGDREPGWYRYFFDICYFFFHRRWCSQVRQSLVEICDRSLIPDKYPIIKNNPDSAWLSQRNMRWKVQILFPHRLTQSPKL